MKKVRLAPDWKLNFKFPCTRVIIGNIQTWVHAMSFADYNWCKEYAIHYQAQTQNRTDFSAIKPDPEIMKILQLIKCCRVEQYSEEMTFEIIMGQEVAGINRIKQEIPQILINAVCQLSDRFGSDGLIPIKSDEVYESEEQAKVYLVEALNKDDIYEHLNYFSYLLFQRPLADNNDMPISHYLNVINRDEHAKNLLIDAFSHLMQLMASSSAGI